MKLKVNNYVYKNPILENITMLNISDTHSEVKYINLVLKYLKENKIDYILFPGDIIDNADRNNDLFLDKVKEFGKYAKTYIAIGNHDNLNLKTRRLLNKKELMKNSLYKKLYNVKNIHLSIEPYNNIEVNDKLSVTQINLPNSYYESKEKIDKSLDFFKELEHKKVNKNKFNIMLIHSPNAIISNNKLISNKLINNMNLIVAGHNHGGITPTFIQDKINNHIGLFGPYTTFLNKNAYGIYNANNTYLLISNGITKITKSTGFNFLSNPVNTMFIPEIDIITFKKDNNYKLELIDRSIYKG